MAIYYVDSAAGDDGNSGLSEVLAWQTMTKVNAASFSADDQILFKRGQSFAAGLVVPSSGTAGHPITFGAYGTGAPPMITAGTNGITTNSKNYITIQQLLIKSIAYPGNGILATGSTGTTINYCQVHNCGAAGIRALNSPTTAINNCTICGNFGGITANGATTVVVVKNCIIAGNDEFVSNSYGLYALNSASLTYSYCIITGNGSRQWPNTSQWDLNTNVSSGCTDGGNNQINLLPELTSRINGNAYFCFTFDDYLVDYWEDIAAMMAPYGAHFTAFCAASWITPAEETSLATMAAAGHEIAVHTWSHPDLTATVAGTLTSTNTNPTIDVDRATTTVTLYCDEVGNRITYDWSGGKAVEDFKAALVGKGWTYTNATYFYDALKLSSWADTAGPQACPHDVDLDISSGNGYPFWADEITATKTWLETVTGVTPTTMAYPYGYENAGVRAFIKDVAGLDGARSYGSGGGFGVARLSSLSVYSVPIIHIDTIKGTESEASIRGIVRHLVEFCRSLGGIYILLTHRPSGTPTDLTVEQAGWVVDELYAAGEEFTTFGDIIAAIKADHSTSDNVTYTKSYSDVSNFYPLLGSPAIDGGTDLALTPDIMGTVVPKGAGPDLGAYEYATSIHALGGLNLGLNAGLG